MDELKTRRSLEQDDDKLVESLSATQDLPAALDVTQDIPAFVDSDLAERVTQSSGGGVTAADEEIAGAPSITAAVEPAEPAGHHGLKMNLKQRILNELNEIWKIILFLAVSFLIIETFRCATLLVKASENDFLAGYATALIGALVVGKVVIVGEKMRFVNRLNHMPLIFPVLYKSVVFTVFVNLILHAEDKWMHRSHESFVASIDPTKYWVAFAAHQLAFFVTFAILFTLRELQKALGEGTMYRLFFVSRDPKS